MIPANATMCFGFTTVFSHRQDIANDDIRTAAEAVEEEFKDLDESVQAKIRIEVQQRVKESWESERAGLPKFIKPEDVEQTFYEETYHKVLATYIQKAKSQMTISKWLPKEMLNIVADDAPLMTMVQEEYDQNGGAGMAHLDAHLKNAFEAAVTKVPLFMQSAMRNAQTGLR